MSLAGLPVVVAPAMQLPVRPAGCAVAGDAGYRHQSCARRRSAVVIMAEGSDGWGLVTGSCGEVCYLEGVGASPEAGSGAAMARSGSGGLTEHGTPDEGAGHLHRVAFYPSRLVGMTDRSALRCHAGPPRPEELAVRAAGSDVQRAPSWPGPDGRRGQEPRASARLDARLARALKRPWCEGA